ncbi:MAG: tetratricopeptide repeat protein [Candidatus Aureabacteria bacterium]|nr:tetratricopeptide repeat protein [Candidatus Auribacterota bacterium]
MLEARFSPGFYLLPPGMDEYNYDRLAFGLSRGEGDTSGLLFSLPLYPLSLALSYALFGRDLLLLRLIQAGLGAGSAVVLYFLGKKMLGEKPGILAAVLLSLYGMTVFHEGLLVPATLALFLSLVSLLFWTGAREGFFRGALGGILLGLAALTAAANLLFAAFLLVFLIARGRGGRRSAGGAILGILLALAFPALINYRLSGDLIPISAHGGVNFYIGHNPEANGGYRTPLAFTPSASGIIRDSLKLAVKESGRPLSPAEASRFWFKKGLDFIRSSPATALRVARDKLRLLLSRWEYCDVGGARIGQQVSFRFLGIPLIPFLLIGPWGLAGMVLGLFRGGGQTLGGGQRRSRLIVYLYAGAQAAGILLFFYQARARILLIPVFCLFAANAVFAFLGAVGERYYRRAAIILALTAGFTVLSAAQPWVEMRSETNILIMAAQDEAGEGRHEAALEKMARARKLNPELGGADLAAGGIFFLAGERAKAEDSFRRAVKEDPLNPDPALNLGFLLLGEKRLREAEEEALKAFLADPLSSQAQILFARIAGERNDTDKEMAAYRRTLEFNPNEVEALLNLGAALAQRGDFREAERLRRRADRIEPNISKKWEVGSKK